MVTKRDDNRQGEYRTICLWKMDWQSFAILHLKLLLKVEYMLCTIPTVLPTMRSNTGCVAATENFLIKILHKCDFQRHPPD